MPKLRKKLEELLANSVMRNAFALYLFQALNYALPLLLFPYLVRTLGLEGFGTWMFALAFIVVGRVCVSYGFDLTATRQVALLGPGNQQALSQMVADIVAIRLLIVASFFLVVVPLLAWVPGDGAVALLVAIGSFILLGEAILPIWLYQGLERIASLVAIRAGVRLMNLTFVVMFVSGPEDIWLVPSIEAGALLLGSIISMIYARKCFGINIVLPKIQGIQRLARDGSGMFLTNLAVLFYTTISPILLGIMVGPLAVASYSIAEKVYSVARGLIGPFVQAVFPGLSRKFTLNRWEFESDFARISKWVLAYCSLSALLLVLTAERIVSLVAGGADSAAVSSLYLFALALPFGLGSFFAPMLVARGRTAELLKITLTNGALGLVLVPVLGWMYAAPGAAFAFLIVQIYNAIALYRVGKSDFRSQPHIG